MLTFPTSCKQEPNMDCPVKESSQITDTLPVLMPLEVTLIPIRIDEILLHIPHVLDRLYKLRLLGCVYQLNRSRAAHQKSRFALDKT